MQSSADARAHLMTVLGGDGSPLQPHRPRADRAGPVVTTGAGSGRRPSHPVAGGRGDVTRATPRSPAEAAFVRLGPDQPADLRPAHRHRRSSRCLLLLAEPRLRQAGQHPAHPAALDGVAGHDRVRPAAGHHHRASSTCRWVPSTGWRPPRWPSSGSRSARQLLPAQSCRSCWRSWWRCAWAS